MAAKIEPLLTLEDLDACPDDGNRYELVGGELFVSRAPSVRHQRILHNLQIELGLYLRDHPIGILVPGPGAVFSQYDAVIPDLVLVLNERWEQIASGPRIIGAPDIVIEIMSPGAESRRRDLSVKRQLYAKHGVSEYWVVDPENLSLDIHRLKVGVLEKIATFKDDEHVASLTLPGFNLTTSGIFVP